MHFIRLVKGAGFVPQLKEVIYFLYTAAQAVGMDGLYEIVKCIFFKALQGEFGM
jgi:hypothetical protein